MEILLPSTTLTHQGREMAIDYIKNCMEYGVKPFEGEYKTSEESEMIEKVNTCMKSFFSSLDLPQFYSEIDPNQVHFLDNNTYNAFIPDAQSGGVTFQIYNAVYIRRDDRKDDYPGQLFRLLHEVVHLKSKTSFRFDEDKLVIGLKQVGLNFITNSESAGSAFIGFNEALTDLIAHDIQLNNFELFHGEGNTPENTTFTSGSYPEELNVFDVIIMGISKKIGIHPRNIFIEFYRSAFTGNTKPYKYIDQTFGSGSLKILSSLGQERSNNSMSDDERQAFKQNILDYFNRKLELINPIEET